MLKTKIDLKIFEKGIKFECQGSGKCCTSHGEFGFVFLTLSDRKRMAKHLELTTSQFTKKFCQRTNGFWHLIENPNEPDCQFLKNKKCSIYAARPTQCRTWPFWPEVMNAKAWKKEVVNFCPGVGKGSVIKFEKINKDVQEQIASEEDLAKEAQEI